MTDGGKSIIYPDVLCLPNYPSNNYVHAVLLCADCKFHSSKQNQIFEFKCFTIQRHLYLTEEVFINIKT